LPCSNADGLDGVLMCPMLLSYDNEYSRSYLIVC
jgi:hypothetical protein